MKNKLIMTLLLFTSISAMAQNVTAHRHPNSTSMHKSTWRTFSTRATRYGRLVPAIRQPTPMSFHRLMMRYALCRAVIQPAMSSAYS